MFRHQGKSRTISHNIRIASVLSFVAGMVNVAGFLSIQILTTNITGHFAFFIDHAYHLDILGSLVFLLYILSFLLGSFTSGTLIEAADRARLLNIFFLPTLLEIILLLCVAFFGVYLSAQMPNALACTLLFAMGLQNSFVTHISKAVVRTTHLTGLFTDLGIELSRLMFARCGKERQRLKQTIWLRLAIILFFFIGGLASGLLYSSMGLRLMFAPAAILITGIFYDALRYRYIIVMRKIARHI
jgi:uncharacterized membrane protein YoaK (UPF0700 family)